MPLSDRARRGLVLGLPALLAAALYARTLGHGFPFDDDLILRQNAFIRSPANAAALVTPRYFESGEMSWRPVPTLTHIVEAALVGMPDVPPAGWERALAAQPVPWAAGLREPPAWIFHATSVVLHAACAALVAALALALAGPAAALLAGLLFAAHPVCAEAVCVASFREDLLALAGSLGALLLLRPGPTLTPLRLAAGWAGAAVAILSKESALLLPVLLLAAEWLLAPSGSRRDRRTILRVHGPVLAVAALYAATRFFLLVSPQEAVHSHLSPTLPYRLLLLPALLVAHARLLLWPATLHADYWPVPVLSASDARFLGGTVLGLAVLAAAAWAWRRRAPLAGVGAALLATSLAPILGISPLPNPLAERYLYAPAAGAALLLAAGFSAVGVRRPTARPAALGIAAVLVVLGALRTGARVPDWESGETIREATVRSGLRSLRALAWQIEARRLARDWDGWIEIARRQLALFEGLPFEAAPGRFHAVVGLGQAWRGKAYDLQAAGRPASAELDEAARWLAESHRLAPDHWIPVDELGLVAKQRGDAAEARRRLEEAVRLAWPSDAMVRGHLAELLETAGDRDGAEREYRAALRTDPRSSVLHRLLGMLLVSRFPAGDPRGGAAAAEAASHWAEAAAANPWDHESRYNLGVFRLLQGDFGGAVVPLGQAFALSPDRADIARAAADARERTGDLHGAREALERWARLEPENPEPRRRLGAPPRG
ncbi:MAG: tetratricopeptide repeat protein [Planctomycetales bacterium]|nr:tetratricopeptide repeat protein [Planctomycetales bacterium]